MAPSFRITSSIDGASLALTPASRGYWRARLVGPGVSAETRVYTYSPHDSFSGFFAALARDWGGWEGTKEYHSLERELRLRCTTDRTGHITIRVCLQSVVDLPGAWSADVLLVVEAGQLEALADSARRFEQAAVRVIFHIAAAADWKAAQDRGRYEVASLATEGFIHCSTREQVVDTANRIFRGRADLVLLSIDEARVDPEIRYEKTEGGDALFPHIHGSLNLDAVNTVLAFPPQPDGSFVLPEDA